MWTSSWSIGAWVKWFTDIGAAGKTDIMSHGSTHRNAIDTGLLAYERGRQTTYTVRRLSCFNVILVTWCWGEVVSLPNYNKHYEPRIPAQEC